MAALRKVSQLDLDIAYYKVAYWFFSYPNAEYTLTSLVEVTNISKTTANRVVTRLINEGFLTKKEIGKAWLITCNQQHIYNFSEKVANNLKTVLLSGIVQEVHKVVKNPRAIILFGSYRKGDDTDKSDIDIAVEVSDNKELRIQELVTFQEFGYRKNVKVNLHIFSRAKIDLNLFANIANGIVLDGFLEVRP